MKKFLNDLITFLLFVAAIVCFYFAATATFTSALLNFILFLSAIFFLIQAAGFLDKTKGFGKYDNNHDSTKKTDNDNSNDN